MRRLLLLLLIATGSADLCPASDFIGRLPREAPVCEGAWQADSVITRLSDMPRHDIEGLWRMTDDGAVVAVERWTDHLSPAVDTDTYRMVMVESSQRYPRPGTLVGYISATAVPGSFDAGLYTDFNNTLSRLLGPKRFTVSVSTDDRLIIRPVKSGIKVDIRRLLPYMFRFRISTYNTRPEGLDGAIRVWPVSDAAPANPRYL